MNDPLVVDVTHWQLDNKAFQEQRKANWPMVEEVFTTCINKNKKAINAIKKYYLKGELPNWQALYQATDHTDIKNRHLDIVTFLWLHPSSAPEVLAPLVNAYFAAGFGRVPEDIHAGIHFLFRWGVMLTITGVTGWKPKCPCFEGKGQLLFNIIFAHVQGLSFYFEGAVGIYNKQSNDHVIQVLGFNQLLLSAKWLCLKKFNPISSAVILQYREVCEFMFMQINSDKGVVASDFSDYFIRSTTKAFYRLANFDIEKEGDTPRTRYVKIVREILDAGGHWPQIDALWAKLKNNEIVVQDPWKLP